MADVGEDKKAAHDSVTAIFEALSKKKQMELLGEYNEALLYISRH
jgi:hypothetical protein